MRSHNYLLKHLIYCSWIVFGLAVPFKNYAQENDNLKAMELRVLEANLSLEASKTSVEIAANNYTKGNANLTPTIQLVAGDNVSFAAITNKSSTGIENRNGFRLNNSISAGVQSEMVLYNGKRNQNLYERFNILVDAADLDQKMLIEDLVYETRLLYFQAIRQNQQISATLSALTYAEQRLQLANNKLDIGTGNKVEVLQAELDRNQYLTEIEVYMQNMGNIEDMLNQLMNLPPGTPMEIKDTIFVLPGLQKEGLKMAMMEQNTNLRLFDITNKLALNDIAEMRGRWQPELRGNLGYQFTRADNGGGFFLVNMNNGFVGGLNLVVPIYDGKKAKNDIKNANLAYNQNKLLEENQRSLLLSGFEQFWRNYTTALKLAQLQEHNVRNARENMVIGLERFKVGVTDGFEFKQIQQSFIESYFRYIDALHQAKINELELQRLAGNLLTDANL